MERNAKYSPWLLINNFKRTDLSLFHQDKLWQTRGCCAYLHHIDDVIITAGCTFDQILQQNVFTQHKWLLSYNVILGGIIIYSSLSLSPWWHRELLLEKKWITIVHNGCLHVYAIHSCEYKFDIVLKNKVHSPFMFLVHCHSQGHQ